MNDFLEILNEVIGDGAVLLSIFITAILIGLLIDIIKHERSSKE